MPQTSYPQSELASALLHPDRVPPERLTSILITFLKFDSTGVQGMGPVLHEGFAQKIIANFDKFNLARADLFSIKREIDGILSRRQKHKWQGDSSGFTVLKEAIALKIEALPTEK